MKKRFLGALLSVLLICSMLTGCAQIKNAVESGVQSAMNEASSEIKSALDEASSEIRSALDEASSDIESALKGESGKESSSKKESSASSQASGSYTMADVKKLKNTGHFAKNTPLRRHQRQQGQHHRGHRKQARRARSLHCKGRGRRRKEERIFVVLSRRLDAPAGSGRDQRGV